MPAVHPDVLRFADALRRLASRPELVEKLMDKSSSEQAQDALGVSPEMATELKNVLRAMRPKPGGRQEPNRAAGAVAAELEQAKQSLSTSQEFLDTSFNQLKWAYRISMTMSSLVFAVGLAFLIIAAVRTFTNPEGVYSTAVIGGLGIVQIVALFYRNPLRDIGRAVSNAQQSKMAVMSYMLGVSLVGESVYGGKAATEALGALSELTEEALQRMEHFSEGQEPPSAAPEPVKTT